MGSNNGREPSDKNLVLVADGEELVREALEEILRLAGLAVLSTTRGEEAVSLFQKYHAVIETVILDIRLQGVAGEQVLETIQTVDPQVKVVLTSDYSQDEVKRRLHGRQVTAYLSKPYFPDELLQLLETISLFR